MQDTLIIYDANVLIAGGVKSKRSCNWKVPGTEFPTGGMAALFNKLGSKIKYNDNIVITFDSKTNRQEILPEYKKNREFNPKIKIQSDECYKILKRCGFNAFKVEGFESDDLIYNLVNLNYNRFKTIIVVTNDHDLCINIDDMKKVSIEAANSRGLDITRENYETSIVRGEYVAYNSVVIHKMLFGDKSDSVSAFGLVNQRWDLYRNFISFAKERGFYNSTWSNEIVIAEWLTHVQPLLPEKEFANLCDRADVLLPIIVTDEELKKELAVKEVKVSKNSLATLLSAFSLNNALKYSGILAVSVPDSLTMYIKNKGDSIATNQYTVANSLVGGNFEASNSFVLNDV